MRLRVHRQRLGVCSPSVRPDNRHDARRLTRTRRIRRCGRIGALLTAIGLIRLARVVGPRWRPLLAGAILTVTGVMLRSTAWSALLLAGLWFLVYAAFIPASPD